MLAGGIVEPASDAPGRVCAIVAYNPSPSVSRLFKVSGPANEPAVAELPAATTVDLGRFRTEVRSELEQSGAAGEIVSPEADWVHAIVQKHLDASD